VRRDGIIFLAVPWAQTASATKRADAAEALARSWRAGGLTEDARRDAERAMMALLDDPAPLVRRRLAEFFAAQTHAPRALVSALAADQSDIAAPVLAHSPLLSDAELIDIAATGDALAQEAIAHRSPLSANVCAALAEVGASAAAIALARNPGAEIPEFSLRRLVTRLGEIPELREALLARRHLPATVRSELIAATARCLQALVLERGWLSETRVMHALREARDRANVVIASDAADNANAGLRELVAHLRRSEQLTASLVLRALLSGHRGLFEAALVELSGLRAEKVAGLLRNYTGAGFAALFTRAGLPPKYLPAFRAALAAGQTHGRAQTLANDGPRLSLAMIENVVAVCDALNDGELDRLLALLRRFELEAALEDARDEIRRIDQTARTEMILAPRQPPKGVERGPLIDLSAFEISFLSAA
jgi:uncharacterized protein (DUF2336 family)